MVIDRKPKVQQVLEDQRPILYPLLRYMINASYADLDYNVPFTRKSVAKLVILAAIAVFSLATAHDDE